MKLVTCLNYIFNSFSLVACSWSYLHLINVCILLYVFISYAEYRIKDVKYKVLKHFNTIYWNAVLSPDVWSLIVTTTVPHSMRPLFSGPYQRVKSVLLSSRTITPISARKMHSPTQPPNALNGFMILPCSPQLPWRRWVNYPVYPSMWYCKQKSCARMTWVILCCMRWLLILATEASMKAYQFVAFYHNKMVI